MKLRLHDGKCNAEPERQSFESINLSSSSWQANRSTVLSVCVVVWFCFFNFSSYLLGGSATVVFKNLAISLDYDDFMRF